MISRRRFLTIVPGAVAAASLPAHGQVRTSIAGAWMGATTAHGITIKVLTLTANVPVTLTLTGHPVQESARTETSDALGVATFVLTGLAAQTRYRYTVSAPGEAPIDGSFRTFADGPFSFRALFASCANTGSSSPVFTAMREMQPDLFVHMGDLHYEDINRNEIERFRRAFHEVLASPTQSALFRTVPFAYTWDDHDYGRNNADRTSPSRPAALAAYRRFIPHYPLAGDPQAPIHHAFTVGRVRFVMTDVRAERSPRSLPQEQRTMLGAAQLAWLERELEAAAAWPLVVWVNTVPWITRRNESTSDGWAPYARERRHIADLIVRLGLTRKLVMLSGDAHMLAMDDGTHSQYSTLPEAPAHGFVVAHAAPMDRSTSKKGGPYSHPEVRANGQYGVMDVSDTGGPIAVKLFGMLGAGMVSGMMMELTV